MSLRWRIMGLTVLVVVVTALVSVGVGYYATQARLGVFVDQIGDDEATRIARNLSREYYRLRRLADSGQGAVRGRVHIRRSRDGDGESDSEGGEGESSELFHQDRIRVVIVGADGRVVEDNLSDLPLGEIAPDMGGHRGTVFDLADEPARGATSMWT